MKITEVKVTKIENQGNLKGAARVVLDNEFIVKGIKIIQSEEKCFIAMPDKKDKQGRFHEVCHPITKEFRDKLSEAILTEFYK